jgi:hypothetical protein
MTRRRASAAKPPSCRPSAHHAVPSPTHPVELSESHGLYSKRLSLYMSSHPLDATAAAAVAVC